MKRFIQFLSLDTVLLPLVICVVLPTAAGAWWRHSYGNVQPPVETAAACEVPRTMGVNSHVR